MLVEWNSKHIHPHVICKYKMKNIFSNYSNEKKKKIFIILLLLLTSLYAWLALSSSCLCVYVLYMYIGKCSYYIYIFKKVSILCENIHFFAATKQILSLNFFYYLFLIWLLVLCVVCARAYVLFPLLIYTYMNVSTAMAARDDLWTEHFWWARAIKWLTTLL